jgi:polysaccharide biosynthesis protein PslH
MKVLILTTAIPSKYGTGADIASRHFIEAIKTLGHSVSVVGYQRWGDPSTIEKDMIVVGQRHIETKSARWHPIVWSINGFIRRLPYTSAKYYSARYLSTVKKLLAEQHYDAIVLEHSSQLCWLKPAIDQGHKLAVLAHNIEHAIFKERIPETKKH